MGSSCRWWISRTVPVALFGVGLALAPDARARCTIEELGLAFSYPNESTEAVPPDAVLWLVPTPGDIVVRLDGVVLEPVGDSPADKFQFKPPSPLTLGEHHIDATVTPILIEDEQPPREIQLTFTVAELAPVFGDVESLEVRRFRSNEPQPERFADCPSFVPLEFGCDDIVPPAEDWLSFAPSGQPLAYLVDGRRIVSVGCEQSVFNVRPAELAVDYEVAAILPTGVAEARVVRAVDVPSNEATSAESGCTLAPASALTSPRWLAGALLAAVALGRRRRSQVGRPLTTTRVSRGATPTPNRRTVPR